jgi:hypothetical protein
MKGIESGGEKGYKGKRGVGRGGMGYIIKGERGREGWIRGFFGIKVVFR